MSSPEAVLSGHRLPMAGRPIRVLSALALLACALWWPAAVGAEAEEQMRRVLIINSHSQSNGLERRLSEGAQQALAAENVLACFEQFDLYTSNQPGNVPAPEDVAYLQERIGNGDYDAILLNNNIAANLFFSGRIKAPPAVRLVITSYYGDLAARIRESGVPVAGVQTPLSSPHNARLALQLVPEATHVVMISNAQYVPEIDLQQPYEMMRGRGVHFEVVDGRRHSTPEMMRIVESLPERTSVIIFHSWGSTKERPRNSYAALSLIRQRYHGLILTSVISDIEQGAAGGHLINGHEQGRTAGRMLARLLTGKDGGGELPVVRGKLLKELDYPTLRSQGIPYSLVPCDFALLRVPESWYVRYSREVWLSVLCLVLISGTLLGTLIQRQHLLERMGILIDHIPLRISVIDAGGRKAFCHVPENDTLCGEGHDEQGKCACPSNTCDFMLGNALESRNVHARISKEYLCSGRHRQAIFVPLGHTHSFGKDAVLAISYDTEDISRARQQSLELAEQLRSTLKAVGDGVIVTDGQRRVTLVNDRAAQMLGQDAGALQGQPLDGMLRLVSPSDGSPVEPPVRQALETCAAAERPDHADLLAADGACRHVSLTATPVLGSDGAPFAAVLVLRDLTAEIDHIERLRRDNSVLRQAMHLGNFISLTIDADGPHVQESLNDSFWPRGEDGQLLPIEAWVAPEHVQQATDAWHDLTHGLSDGCSVFYAAGLPGEPRRYFNFSAERLPDTASGKTTYCCVLQEVTDIRTKELMYGDNLQLLTSILDHLPASVFLKDADHGFRYLKVNPAHQTITGIPADELIGKTDDDFLPPDNPMLDYIHQHDREVMESGKTFKGDVNCVNSVGRNIYLHTIKTPLLTASGQRLLLGMHLDITALRQLETAQRQTIATLNEYVANERLVNQLLTMVLKTDNFDANAHECLRLLAQHYDADRCFIFRYTDDSLEYASRVYSWLATRDGSPAGSDDSHIATLPGWNERIRCGKTIVIDDLDQPPEGLAALAEAIRPRGIRSLLVSPIHIDGHLYGYCGMDFRRAGHAFRDLELTLMHTCARIFGLFLGRQRQWQTLRDSEAFMRQIIDSISMPITILDPTFRIVLANPSAAAQGHMTPQEAIGTHCYDSFCHKGKNPDGCPVAMTLLDHQPHSVQNIHEQDQTIISTSQPLFDSSGVMKYILSLNIDISEQAAQKQLLQDALDQAQAANRAKGTFLATVSHELRTPLNVVIGYSELMLGKALTPEQQRDYLSSINYAGTSLLALINDVLDISKLEADRLALFPTDINLDALIASIVKTFSLKSDEKKLKLDYTSLGLRRRLLHLDEARVRQVLYNLIGNAMKFTMNGSVRVRAFFHPDDSHADQPTGRLLVSVIDTGPGISPELQEHIFEPFVQDITVRRFSGHEGTGLGLSISHRLVEQMNGTILLHSAPGEGSDFTIRLAQVPYRDLPDDGSDDASLTGHHDVHADTPRCRILAVDDVLLNLKVIAAMLERQGHECVTVSSPLEALELIRRDKSFDIILSDLWMPDLDGATLARRIREIPGFAAIPIVAVTADVQILDQHSDAFDDILLKPFTGDSIAAVISRVLHRPKARLDHNGG